MTYLFAPLQPFVGNPLRILAVAAIVLGIAAWTSIRSGRIAWPVFATGLAWAVFAVWEVYCNSQGYNIRIDMILIAPVLLVSTLWGVADLFSPGFATRPIRNQYSLRTLIASVTIVALALGMIVWLAK